MTLGWERKDPKDKSIADKKEKKEISRIEMFLPEPPTRKLKELVVPDRTYESIDSALNRILHHKRLYYDWDLQSVDPKGKRTAINLYGSPGTGKSFCAEAIANHLGKRIIKVNYAEIESKYVGETPKNITAAFRKAKETDSVLFFDEADSILGKRLTNVTQSSDHGVNVSRSVMLLQLDSFEGVVLFATNLQKNYDGAFVRRILAHIEFGLPNKECRRKLWSYLIPQKLPIEKTIEMENLAEISDGLSGGDILNVVINSASRAVNREYSNQYVSIADFEEEINRIRIAKESIGDEKQTTVKREEYKKEELPDRIKNKYEEKNITQREKNE